MAKILIMDDNEAICHSIERWLPEHELIYLLDGKLGLEVIATFKPDLIVVDLNMPEVNGIEVIIEAKKTYPDLPVIAISGDGSMPPATNLNMSKHLGASAVLEKPLDKDELQALIKSLLDG